MNAIADKISRIREQFQAAKKSADAQSKGDENVTSEFTNFHKFDNDFHDFSQNFDNFSNSTG
jgi:hypothetical protein